MEAETRLFTTEFGKARKLAKAKRTKDRIAGVVPVHKLTSRPVVKFTFSSMERSAI